MNALRILLVVVFMVAAGCMATIKKNNETMGSKRESVLPSINSEDYVNSVKLRVREQSDKTTDCYAQALEKSENLVGKLYFSWDILEDGKMEKLRVNRSKSTLKDKGLESCMLEVLSKIKFDKPVGKKIFHVNYPFRFTGKK